MDINFFRKIRILDGGMGQELLARGLDPGGTLWSAKALLEKKNHSLIEEIHEDFVKKGADVIVTNTFATRRLRLKQNNLENKFEILNKQAGEIAKKIKDKYPKVLIAGGLPPQNNTYSSDDRDENEIFNNFKDQAKILDPYVDFFYFDVLSSIREISIAENSIKEFNKPFLIGAHISEGTSLPSGEKLSDITKKINCKNLLGLILACVSPENFKKNINEIKSIGYPFGFKINGYVTTKPKNGYSATFAKLNGNPNKFLGHREDFTSEKVCKITKKYKNHGATILGGCCETRPSHISAMASNK